MPQFDLPLELLEQYAPELPEPEGFAEFWRSTVAEARAPRLEPASSRSTPASRCSTPSTSPSPASAATRSAAG